MTEANLSHRGNSLSGRLIALAAAIAATLCLAVPNHAGASFITGFEAGVYDKVEGLDISQPEYENTSAGQWARRGEFAPLAGAHPFRAETHIHIKTLPTGPAEYPKDIVIEVPEGLVVNPQAVPTCTRAALSFKDCPKESQVGVVLVSGFSGGTTPVYNIVPRRGVPAEFGFIINRMGLVSVSGEVTADGQIRAVSLSTPQALPLTFIRFGFFGVPYDPDNRRFHTDPVISLQSKPLVTTPTSCVGPVDTILEINSWMTDPFERWVTPTPVGGTGCEDLDFSPRTEVTASSGHAGEPTGLSFRLEVPQNDEPDGRATAHVKDVEVQLPEGMRVNASAADGLAGCSLAQVDLGSTDPVACPDGSKIGSVQVETPLLKEQVGGAVYLATPYENPFGSLIGLYVVAENAERGIRLKIPGRVDIDPVTGGLTARFEDNPQLPYTSLRVSLNGGPRAPLMLPDECGSYEVVTRVSPWSAADPENPTEAEVVTGTSTLSVNQGCGAAGFAPDFAAGTHSALAGGSSPFVLNARRDDGEQEFSSLDQIRLPEGLLGYISRVETCEAAHADLGICGPGSQIGRVLNSVGAGPRPAWIPQPGKTPTSVHLAGPYRGAPYSLSIVVPAQAGPFDLGRVVVRTPLHVNERTAQITTEIAESRVFNRAGQLSQHIQGALPRMLEGIPLEIRTIRVLADRPGFMVNPTSCKAQAVGARAISTSGALAGLSSPFAARGCGALGFAPRFRARIMNKGRRSTLRSFNPRTKFVVVPRKGDANIGGARVVLPSSTILDQANIGTTCTRAQMAAEECPEGSIVGYAKAFSPVLNKPIRGPVYLAANGGVRPLPDLAAVLDGEVRLVLQGEISTLRTRRTARLQNTFRIVPDAPVSRFVLTMRGGKNRGLLVNSTDLCRTRERGIAVFTGQNGDRQRLRPRITTRFRGCKKARRRTARRTAKRKAARKSAIRSIAREAR